jgi:flagellar basal-body rod protein FlgG
MAIAALHSAATGLRALSTQIDVVANNLANAETNSFKRSRVNFEDLMYQVVREPGTQDQTSEVSPSGEFVGLGTRISNTQLDLTQGSLESTDNPLDIGIQGNGFFAVKILDSLGSIGYTRNGSFFVNSQSQLVLGMGDGYQLVPPITLPTGVTDIEVSQDGTISAIKPGSNIQTKVGQFQLTQFINPQGLKLLGGDIYTATEASGKPITTSPEQQGAGQLMGGFVEASNVDPVKELVTMIQTQRAFELNSQSIQTADQILQTVGNLKRS